MSKKLLFIVLAAIMSVVFLTGCKKAETTKTTNESSVLVVGTNAEFAPFEYMEGDNITGFDMDLMAEIAAILGKDIKIANMKFDGLLFALQSKKIDVIVSGMTATDERKKSINFSDPYFVSKQAIMVKDSNEDITGFNSLDGKKIGVVIGYTGDLIVTEQCKNADIIRYKGTSEAIMALMSGKVDACVLDYEPAKSYAAKNSGIKVIDTDLALEEYSIGLRKEDTALLEKINKALAELRENGTYDLLIEKYFSE